MGIADWLHQLLSLGWGAVALALTVITLAPMVQSGDVSFSAAAIAVVTALLGSVVAGLGVMFKAYQAAVSARIADLLARIVQLEKDLAYERSLNERGTAIAETAAAAYRGREQSNQPPGSRGTPYA